MTIFAPASVPPGSLASSGEIVATASCLGTTLALPEGFDRLEDPGLVPGSFAGQPAPPEYTTENAGSESGTQHDRHARQVGWLIAQKTLLPRVHRSARAGMAVCA